MFNCSHKKIKKNYLKKIYIVKLIIVIYLCVFIGDSTGLYSVYNEHESNEIMFHVSTLLPYTQNNRYNFYKNYCKKWPLNLQNDNLFLLLQTQKISFFPFHRGGEGVFSAKYLLFTSIRTFLEMTVKSYKMMFIHPPDAEKALFIPLHCCIIGGSFLLNLYY